jgi:hypothetical protein
MTGGWVDIVFCGRWYAIRNRCPLKLHINAPVGLDSLSQRVGAYGWVAERL